MWDRSHECGVPARTMPVTWDTVVLPNLTCGLCGGLGGSLGDELDGARKCLVHIGLPPVAALFHLRAGLVVAHRGAIAAGGRKGVVDVDDADDLGAEWDLIAAQAVGVPGAVILLVMPADDRFDVPGKLHALQQLDAPDGMHFNDVELVGGET